MSISYTFWRARKTLRRTLGLSTRPCLDPGAAFILDHLQQVCVKAGDMWPAASNEFDEWMYYGHMTSERAQEIRRAASWTLCRWAVRRELAAYGL
ncbi:hypothetical protein [Nonomuraea rhodomycinica]|uniref:Uncharacterized protein n=1 Tax=Nonomuraea rhodomycinica TaxID=1712872 RepID=A0A7Y6IW63_9ACTN|nr:hypothetical protein [Nonomuraea rhodomycinica]NUW45522.1 hypothetical protein [Nonomuraea rhodomycinica]